MEAAGRMVSEKEDFLIFFSHYKFMSANDPRAVASLIGKIYVGDR